MQTEKRITKATIKKFIRDNEKNLHIRITGSHNAMDESWDSEKDEFTPVEWMTDRSDYEMGIKGAWFVGQSRDWFDRFENDRFIGFHVFNCCRSFDLAIAK